MMTTRVPARDMRRHQGADAIRKQRELEYFDAVVIDPPRAGAEAQARQLARSSVETVVSVSCDPATFARDSSILVKGGYRIESIVPIDQFAWTGHIEIVGIFRR